MFESHPLLILDLGLDLDPISFALSACKWKADQDQDQDREQELFGMVRAIITSNLFDYLKDLFTRLPAAKNAQIKEFTPATWETTHNLLDLT